MSVLENVLSFLTHKVKYEHDPLSPRTNEELAVELKKRRETNADEVFLAKKIDDVKHQIQESPDIDVPTAVKILYMTQTPIHSRFETRVTPYGKMILENGTIQLYTPNPPRAGPVLEREKVSEDRLEEIKKSPDLNPLPWDKTEVQDFIKSLRYSQESLTDMCNQWLAENHGQRTPEQYRDKAIQYLTYDINQIEGISLNMKALILFRLGVPVHKKVLNCFYERATFQLNEDRALTYYKAGRKIPTEFGKLDRSSPDRIIYQKALFRDFYRRRRSDESIIQLANRFIYMLEYTGGKDYVIAKFESVNRGLTTNDKCIEADEKSFPGTSSGSTSQPRSESGDLMQPTQIPSTSQHDVAPSVVKTPSGKDSQGTEESSDPKPNDLNCSRPEKSISPMQASTDFIQNQPPRPETNLIEFEVQGIIKEIMRAIEVLGTPELKQVYELCNKILERKDTPKKKITANRFKLGLRFFLRMVRKYSSAEQVSVSLIDSVAVVKELIVIGKSVECEEFANQLVQMTEIQNICEREKLKMLTAVLRATLSIFAKMVWTDTVTNSDALKQHRRKVASGDRTSINPNNSETVETHEILTAIEKGIDALSIDPRMNMSESIGARLREAVNMKTNCLDVVESVEECLCLILNGSTNLHNVDKPVETNKILRILLNILNRLTPNNDELKRKVTKLIELSDEAMEICKEMKTPLKITVNILEVLIFNSTNAEENIHRNNTTNS
ncbi:unnamed protein product [Caenorhabditis brenneri]